MLNYKLLKGHFCHYQNLVKGDVKVQIVKRDVKLQIVERVFLSL